MRAQLLIFIFAFNGFIAALLIPFPNRKNLFEFDQKQVAAKPWTNEISGYRTKGEPKHTLIESSGPLNHNFPVTIPNLDVPKDVKIILENDISSALQRNILTNLMSSAASLQKKPVEDCNRNSHTKSNFRKDKNIVHLVAIPAPCHSSDGGIPNRFFVFVFEFEAENYKRGIPLTISGNKLHSSKPQSLARIFVYDRSSGTLRILNSNPENHQPHIEENIRKDSHHFVVNTPIDEQASNVRKYQGTRVEAKNSVVPGARVGLEPRNQVIKKRNTIEFSAMSYALQRLDGDSAWEEQDNQINSKHLALTGYTETENEEETTDTPDLKEALVLSGTENGIGNSTNDAYEPVSDSDHLSESLTNDKEEGQTPEEACVPVTWYTIFHHSVFGTPKLCEQ